jgi:glycerol-3-phosphate acyltransferase PlsX
MRLAVDAMGGDHAPREIVAGCVESLSALGADDVVILVGQEPKIREELSSHPGWNNDPRIEIVHSAEVVGMGDHPVDAIRQKRDNSITRMVMLAAEGKADAIISAGNTGACVAACQMKLRPLKGVHRPGIAVVIPSFSGPMILCDCGANPTPKPHHMHQYAQMASIYAKTLFNMPDMPKVGILNIGEEDDKGNPLVKQGRALIKADSRLNFVGYVEGRTILSGQADVVIADGFVGNVVLKLIEGLSEGLMGMLMHYFTKEDPKLAEAFKPAIKHIRAKHDYSEHGGAPLLGVDGLCIICHGSSDRRAIKNAVLAAGRLAHSNVNKHIAEFINSGTTETTSACACEQNQACQKGS